MNLHLKCSVHPGPFAQLEQPNNELDWGRPMPQLLNGGEIEMVCW